MAQTVFRPTQLNKKDSKFVLTLTKSFEPVEQEKPQEEEEVYTGPTVEELKKQADDFKAQWEQEKQRMLTQAQIAADDIVQKAQEAAFSEVKKQTDSAQVIKTQAQTDAQAIIKNAQEEASKILEEANAKKQDIFQTALDAASKEGKEKGYSEGKAEVERLVERVHIILESLMAKRQEVLDETEEQIVQLVLLVSKKVVKVLSSEQKSVVMENIKQALKKIKGRGNVVIRVNMQDAKLATEHIKDFTTLIENVAALRVMEDSTVEKGGCIIETDFGAVDARISSQLAELEQKILEVSPIKSVPKAKLA